MPNPAVVEDFIATIERGEFLEALPEKDVTAQENNLPPRVGRAAQTANEDTQKHFHGLNPNGC
jgi:hypothetical protein